MRCPYCGNSRTRVIDSRAADDGAAIRRRRRCENCGSRFTTFERRERVEVVVVKRDDTREPYERKKLDAGLHKACNKRDVSDETIEMAVEEIEEAIMKRQEREIPASVIGDLVMQKLKSIDEVAYLRFASVYKRFGNVSEFQKELGELMPYEQETRRPK